MLYKCIEIGEKSYMMWDTQVQCYTDTWYLHSFYALVFGAIYILGIPGMFFSLLYQSRHFDVHRRWLVIKGSPSRLVKTLKLAREDYWSKGMHWSKIKSAKDEMERVKWYLCNKNMRSPKTQMRIGFLYRPFHEDYWAFELFEFGFKLMMTGVMVHIRPGTVTQIIAGLTSCFIAFAIHLGFQPYNDNSNNVLMGAGKMQLFLTLMLALLLKMEAAFFTGNAQMDEADLDSLSAIIIGTSGALVLLWVGSVLHDCWSAKVIRKRQKRAEEEARLRRQRFKKTTNLLKAAGIKGKMFSNMSKVMPKQMGKMDRKNKVKKEQQQKLYAQDKKRMLSHKKTLSAFGSDIHDNGSGRIVGDNGMGFLSKKFAVSTTTAGIDNILNNNNKNNSKNNNERKTPDNYVAKALNKKPASVLMSTVRKDFGAGSEVYVNVVDLIAKIKSKQMTAEEGASRAEYVLRACTPPVKEIKRKEYCTLLSQIGKNRKNNKTKTATAKNGEGKLSISAQKFLPDTPRSAVAKGEKLKPLPSKSLLADV